jgi:hypothetical protein
MVTAGVRTDRSRKEPPVPARYASVALLLAAALVTTTRAQTKPDFSGDWTYDRSKSTVVRVNNANVDAPAFGAGFSARQDATSLRVERVFGSPPSSYTWTFDLTGKQTTNKLPGQNGDDEVISTASWNGNKLVITSTRMSKDSQGKSVATSSLKRTLSISSDGSLKIDASGTPAPIQGTPNVTSVYRKTALN